MQKERKNNESDCKLNEVRASKPILLNGEYDNGRL
jgi:hypothetical protein